MSLIFKILLLSLLNKTIVDELRWNNSAIKQKNRKSFNLKTLKNHIDVVFEQWINILIEFLKKLCQIGMNVFKFNLYWNSWKVFSSMIIATSEFAALKFNFFTFRSLKKFRQNIFIENFRRFVKRFFSRYLKNIRTFKKKKTIRSTSLLNQLM